jgi:hypothetical protein
MDVNELHPENTFWTLVTSVLYLNRSGGREVRAEHPWNAERPPPETAVLYLKISAGIEESAVQFRNRYRKLCTSVLYLNVSTGTVVSLHAKKRDEKFVTFVLYLNRSVGIEVKAAFVQFANALLKFVTAVHPSNIPLGIDVKAVQPLNR